MKIETKFEPGDKVVLISNSVFDNSLPEVFIVESVDATVLGIEVEETNYSERQTRQEVITYRLIPLDKRFDILKVKEDDLLFATKENIEQELNKGILVIRDRLLSYVEK